MSGFYNEISSTDLLAGRSKIDIMQELIGKASKAGYAAVDTDTEKPWGGFVRFDTKDAEAFVKEFFPGLDINEARLGRAEMELSPKFLLVEPGHRLSWQRHDRRAERWAYITKGGYYKSLDPDNQGDLNVAKAKDVVQFQQGECHRLVGLPGDTYTLVAEIWQHTDLANQSDEADIERLADDYKR